MLEYRCYKLDKLMELLGNDFHVINKNAEFDFADGLGNLKETECNAFYITRLTDIKSISNWKGLWREIDIVHTNGEKITLYSNGINSDNTSLLRITKNDFFSPAFELQGNYVVADYDIDEWLKYNGILPEQLDLISENITVYATYLYKNIYEPIIENDEICGRYGKRLKLEEEKIDKALADIKDVEMRLKIELVLKSFEKIHE